MRDPGAGADRAAADAAGMRVVGYAAVTPADTLDAPTFDDMRALPGLV